MPDTIEPASLASAATAALAGELLSLLRDYREREGEYALANPIRHLSMTLSRRLQEGAITPDALEALVTHLTLEGFVGRAQRLARYVGETDAAVNDERLRALFDALAHVDGALADFETFRARIEREVFGIVFTAHPTFNLTGGLMRDLANLAAGTDGDGRPLDAGARDAILRRAAATDHRPDADLSLAREHALSIEAIGRERAAVSRAYRILLDVARTRYPEQWRRLTPRLLTVASWVGYDLDGRSDIRWTDTLHKRLIVQSVQLSLYLERVRAVRAGHPALGADLDETLELLQSRLALAVTQIQDEVAIFAIADPAKPAGREPIRAISRRMHDGRALRTTSSADLVGIIDRALARTADDGLATDLLLLRAELATHGLGQSHTHVRINATQIHNAVRKAVGLVGDPNDPRYRQSYLNRLNALLDGVAPQTINFGSMLGERTSAKQLFMLLAQMLKHNDRSVPIRFLIAESESAFTCLAALYYARLFGIDDSIDISPLFETEKALEGGSRIIEQLLENPHYRAYIARRGRLCVQTGFSDAGRYLGQTPACASIERLRLRLIRVMAQAGLPQVELVIFDTHGESVGRGAHPAGFEDRLSYIDTPATRGFMDRMGVSFKQEVSFQGGDGFLFFSNPDLAYAVVTRILEHVMPGGRDSADDPFYDEAAYIREFFTTVKAFQVRLMGDRDYGALLSAFGANLLFPSGSRSLKRQHDDAAERDQTMPSQLRAIPHNAVLMQLGLLANSVGGVGAAIMKDPEPFRSLYARSRRFRQLIGVVAYAAGVSDPRAMQAYVGALDPGIWVTRASRESDRAVIDRMLGLARHMEPMAMHERQGRVFRALHTDFILLREGLDDVGAPSVDPEVRDAIALLHAIRLTIIHEIFLAAMAIPEFSSRHAVTPQQLIARVLHLDAPSAVDLLEEIFPLTEDQLSAEEWGEPATYRSEEGQNYRIEHETIFRPMRRLHHLVCRISSAVVHRTGFFG